MSYTCFCKSFMLFVSEREKFKSLGLPLLKYTTPQKSGSDFNTLNETENMAIEIDMGRIKTIQRALDIDKLDCYPVVWCQQDQKQIKWSINFAQRIACKYLVVKLIDRHTPTNAHDCNIDMFPLSLEGNTLQIPM